MNSAEPIIAAYEARAAAWAAHDLAKAPSGAYLDAWDSDTVALFLRDHPRYNAIVPAEVPGLYELEDVESERFLGEPMTLAAAIAEAARF